MRTIGHRDNIFIVEMTQREHFAFMQLESVIKEQYNRFEFGAVRYERLDCDCQDVLVAISEWVKLQFSIHELQEQIDRVKGILSGHNDSTQ